jgi:tRNA threonylcarbamoyladenosine biosynthesis protein TsaB
MKVLGIDTSTSCGSVGLCVDGWIVSEYLLNTAITHSERLLKTIDLILKETKFSFDDLDGLSISLGPGSFTGLRIGLSTAKGLAFASKKPVVGLSTLDVLASQISVTPFLICPILDAKKKEVYTAFYRYEETYSLKRLTSYEAISPEELVKKIEEKTIFVGDGVKTYGEMLRNSLKSLAIFPSPSLHLPHASEIARLGEALLLKGEILDISTLTPIYVRPSEAELKFKNPQTFEK